jgi:hypothetical protein
LRPRGALIRLKPSRLFFVLVYLLCAGCVLSLSENSPVGLLYCAPRRAAQAKAFAPLLRAAAFIVRRARLPFKINAP